MSFLAYVQQKNTATRGLDHIKELSAKSAIADALFEQLNNLRVVYEEYTKICTETVPQAEAKIAELNEELDSKTQPLDDVILCVGTIF